MDIRPILSTLLRHKTAAALIVLEIALSCAIICNAVFLIAERVQSIRTPTGIDESSLLRIQITGIGRDDTPMPLTREDLAAIRAVPGVRDVSVANQVPLGQSSWNTSVGLTAEQEIPTLNATMYMGGASLFDTLGAKIVAGRNLSPGEFQDYDEAAGGFSAMKMASILVSKGMADKLWPGQSGVGKVLYLGEDPSTVVGVFERIARPNRGFDDPRAEYAMVLPVTLPYTMGGNYLVRTTDPSRRADALAGALEALKTNRGNRIVLEKQTFDEIRDGFYAQDKAMAWLLVAVIAALLVVTALGIVGLASFWVQQRTKQIGIRRALGATRGQILRYFQTENFLLATIGIAIGMLLAFGINQLLMAKYELPRLPIAYLPLGAITLWLLGQVAVFWPARRAASVPPALATRSV